MSDGPGEANEWGSDQEQELATLPGGIAGLTRGQLAKVRNRQVCFVILNKILCKPYFNGRGWLFAGSEAISRETEGEDEGSP